MSHESLSKAELLKLVNEIIRNPMIEDATILCYKIFIEITKNVTCIVNYKQMRRFMYCLKRLQSAEKFNTCIFAQNLFNEHLTIPFEIIWWLTKTKIMHLIQFEKMFKYNSLTEYILNLQGDNRDDIIVDLILQLLQGCYIVNISLYKLHTRKMNSNLCLTALEELTDKTLQCLLNENCGNVDINNYLLLVPNVEIYFSDKVMHKFYTNIIRKIVTYKGNWFNLYNAYVYQSMWSSNNLTCDLLKTSGQFFKKHCNFEDIMCIIRETDVNWKYTLMTVVSCIKCKSCTIEGTLDKLFQQALKRRRSQELIVTLLMIRQACMENEINMTYQEWYALTFGRKSSFKPEKSTFKFLISVLTTLIPFEPKDYLSIHITESINTPRGCNSLTYDYLNLCKARLRELNRFPYIGVSMNKIQLNVLQILEDCSRNDTIATVLRQIIKIQYPDYYNVILPQILKHKTQFSKVWKLLIENGYNVSEENNSDDLDVFT